MRQKITYREDWTIFSLGYLNLAELSCLEIIEKKYQYTANHGKIIYIPIIFNIRHAIEIFIKTFSIKFLKKDFLDNTDHTHDIQELFLKFREKISKKRLQESIKKWKDENPDNKEEISSDTIFNELESIINKYQNLDFLKTKIGINYYIDDTNNTAFKYPTNDLNIKISYKDLLGKFTEMDAREFLIDVIKLQKIFYQLYLINDIEQTS